MDAQNDYGLSYLILGYLLNNQWQDAKQAYTDIHTDEDRESCRDAILEDIPELKSAGITHPDFERIEELFR